MLETYQQTCPQIALCPDGYIRLTAAHFEAFQLQHLFSGIEHEPPAAILNEGGISTTIFGYTEWVSATSPTLSLGWDWHLHGQNGKAYCVHTGDVRSNIMFVDGDEKDLGPEQTSLLLANWLSSFDWSARVLETL